MKYVIGLFLFTLSFQLLAGSSGVLVLRGRVPASYKIQFEKKGQHLVPYVLTNQTHYIPKISESMKNNHKIISVVQP